MWDSEIQPQGQDLRSKTRQSLILDRETCPIGRISLLHTRNINYSISPLRYMYVGCKSIVYTINIYIERRATAGGACESRRFL